MAVPEPDIKYSTIKDDLESLAGGDDHLGLSREDRLLGADDVYTVLHRTAPQYRNSGVWQADDDTVRILRTLKDANGATYQVEQPRVEYILVPAKTD